MQTHCKQKAWKPRPTTPKQQLEINAKLAPKQKLRRQPKIGKHYKRTTEQKDYGNQNATYINTTNAKLENMQQTIGNQCNINPRTKHKSKNHKHNFLVNTTPKQSQTAKHRNLYKTAK